jgi:hypothetical protein
MRRALCFVALLALACLLLRSARVGLAGDYVDPISRITAQDEALYSHSAIHMATRGGWSTPVFMGRFGLYKPPLLIWLSGLSTRILGVSRLALRLPVALFVSLATGLLFLWVAELRSWQAGAAAALLVSSNHLWHVLGGMCMTDGLLVAFYIAALYCLFADPWLESRLALAGFSASVAGAILTKGVAGVLPLAIFVLYWLAAPRNQKPAFSRGCLAVALAALMVAPWFVYQMLVHGRWFWLEHIQIEILGFGTGAPPQTSRENQALFYFMRLAWIDPVLPALAVAALPAFGTALRKRSAAAVLVLVWIVVVLASVLVWRYRNVSYLLPAVPALAIVAAGYGPLGQVRSGKWMLALAGVAFLVKAAYPAAPWGISLQKGTVQPAAPALSSYCDRARGNELIVVDIPDDLYASVLPLPKLRYAMVGVATVSGAYAMPFDYLGIVIPASQFNDLARWEPLYRERLHEWGLDSTEPVGTLILLHSPAELSEVIRAHPATDFFIPERYLQAVGAVSRATHDLELVPAPFFLLLSRTPIARATPPAWTCHM